MNKQHISIAVVGNVASGKSALAGHLIHLCGGIPTTNIHVHHDGDCTKHVDYSHLLSNSKEELESCFTINIGIWRLVTKRFLVTLIDTPGRSKYQKNLITGVSQVPFLQLLFIILLRLIHLFFLFRFFSPLFPSSISLKYLYI
eukprot:Phypoly_transcript_17661.p1 GENE.Phypoly_transcript_17661~~Phypoly_transcript_17661.p1  ORF type:complete len:143 (+),score=3.23 Phypoly_transcript_17661:62-490(+)